MPPLPVRFLRRNTCLWTLPVAAVLVASIASAGPNRGGTLVLHSNPELDFSCQPGVFCDQTGLALCEDAVTRDDGHACVPIAVLAAFHVSTAPRLTGVTFGWTYDPTVITIMEPTPCGDFQLTTDDWPAPSSGTAVTWLTAQTIHLVPVYTCVAYLYTPSPRSLVLLPHPIQGATFADDSVPPQLDDIAALTKFGFNTDGVLICPASPDEIGACCMLDGSCVVQTLFDCEDGGGFWQGANAPCDPNPCPEIPGACCRPGGSCSVVLREVCAQQGGEFQGEGTDCNPSPCPQPVGACCVDLECTILTSAECRQQRGAYFGNGSTCAVDFCEAALDCADPGRPVANAHVTRSTGPLSRRLELTREGDECGTLLLHADGSYENGYAWSYGGVQPPYFGAIAECYSGAGEVCAGVFDLTSVSSPVPLLDLYVWSDDGGTCPGNVLCLKTGIDLDIAFWPSVSRHVIPLEGCCVPDSWWIGCWKDAPWGVDDFFVAADLNGPGGCSMTCIAPDIGFPTGWNNVSVAWGPTQAMGIGALVRDCQPVPVKATSWGKVKHLFR